MTLSRIVSSDSSLASSLVPLMIRSNTIPDSNNQKHEPLVRLSYDSLEMHIAVTFSMQFRRKLCRSSIILEKQNVPSVWSLSKASWVRKTFPQTDLLRFVRQANMGRSMHVRLSGLRPRKRRGIVAAGTMPNWNDGLHVSCESPGPMLLVLRVTRLN